MAPKLLALIKWIGGVDDKKYTTGIPIEWIKGFEYGDFRSEKFDPMLSYVIEWHEKSKEPAGGWPVYDGYVIEVSNNISLLENKLKILDGLMSPTKIVKQARNEQEKIDKEIDESMYTEQSQLDAPKSPNDKGTTSVMSGCRLLTPIGQKKSRTRLFKSTAEGGSGYDHALRQIQKELKLLRKQRSKYGNICTSESSEDEMKEISRPESGTYISNDQWKTAKRARSYTAMGVNLLMSLYPINVLLKSNFRGGHSKISKSKKAPNHKALDPKILNSLYYTVRRQWKSAFSDAGLGTAINNKLARLRSAEKRKVIDQNQEENIPNE